MAKIVVMYGSHPNSIGGRAPNTLAEVTVPQRPAPGTREKKGVRIRSGELVQVQAQLSHDHRRKVDRALTSCRLGRSEREPSAACFGKLPLNTHGARDQ